MDTSETYIKMCEKAEEIQELWQGLKGDFHAYHGDNMVDTLHTSFGTEWLRQHSIWLPRQDQLQEMVIEHPGDNYNKSMYPTLGSLYMFACSMYTKSEPPWSMEQLWLVFVIKEKYSKVWDGENWVKEK